MAKELKSTIYLDDPETGERRRFLAGTPASELPRFVTGAITNPDLIGEAEDPEPVPAAGFGQSQVVTILSVPTETEVAPTPPGAEPTGEEESLSDLTVKELRARAEAAGLDVPSRARKSELVEALERA